MTKLEIQALPLSFNLVPGEAYYFSRTARVRCLMNGEFVAEIRKGGRIFGRWVGCDRDRKFHRDTTDQHYRDCLCSTVQEALDALAGAGV